MNTKIQPVKNQAVKPEITTDSKDRILGKLYKICALVSVCALASEARRTLLDIEHAAEINPVLEGELSRLVNARHEWTTHDDDESMSTVMHEIRGQLEQVIALANGLAGG
jgi:hypothetical protein